MSDKQAAASAPHKAHHSHRLHRMIGALARRVVGNPGKVAVGWSVVLVLAALLGLVHGPVREPVPPETLGHNQPAYVGAKIAREAFPEYCATTDAVLIFQRDGGLNAADRAAIGQIARQLRDAGSGNAQTPWFIKSAALDPLLSSRLVSADGQAQMIVVSYNLPYNSDASDRMVEKIEGIARPKLNSGLRMEMTGGGGLGRDESIANDVAHKRITFCAVAAVLIVLLLVYRAPLAACVPLMCVAVSAFVATQVLKLLQTFGAPITSEELIYLVVIVFGTGTDFALFWLSRFDEELARAGDLSGDTRHRCAFRAYTATMEGILSSAGTTILGMTALVLSVYTMNHSLGLAMAFSLFISLLAAMSLMPALALLMGRKLFWPRKPRGATGKRSAWPWVAKVVTGRPRAVLAVLAILLAGPLFISARTPYRLNGATGTLSDASYLKGKAIAEKFFSGARLFPYTCIVQLPAEASPGELWDVSQSIGGVMRQAGAKEVWDFSTPLGATIARPTTAPAGVMDEMLQQGALQAYWSGSMRCLRFEVMAADQPFSKEAITGFARIRTAAEQAGHDRHTSAQVFFAGPTPVMANILSLCDTDELRVKLAVTIAVAAVVFMLIGDIWVTLALMAITWLAYQATMGLAGLLFVHLLGFDSVDWEVKMFAFVVLMAVGQDYNLFLVSRLMEERRHKPLAEAVRTSVVRTGGIISSCGLITAASMASLLTSGQMYLEQMGFVLACGALLDTFLIRPFMLPPILVLLGRPRIKM